MDPVTPRSRRAVLVGALGGVAAAAASSLIRPSSVGATDHTPLVVGETNMASLTTTLNNTAGTGTTLSTFATGGVSISGNSTTGKAIQGNSTDTGTAVRALATSGYGVYSTSASGISIMGIAGTVNPPAGTFTTPPGVAGFKSNGTGVWAASSTGIALKATSGGQAANFSSSSASAPALESKSTGGTVGVVGLGANFTPAAYPNGVGVLGDNPDAFGVGVWGRSTNGTGALGESSSVTGYGVEAYGGYSGVYASGIVVGAIGDVDHATGLQGWSGVDTAPNPGTDVGVWAGADPGRTALRTQGVVRMSRSGRVPIAATKSSVVVTVPGGVAVASMGFATLQANRPGYYVQAVAVTNTSLGQITIYLNKALAAQTYVAWFVLG